MTGNNLTTRNKQVAFSIHSTTNIDIITALYELMFSVWNSQRRIFNRIIIINNQFHYTN